MKWKLISRINSVLSHLASGWFAYGMTLLAWSVCIEIAFKLFPNELANFHCSLGNDNWFHKVNQACNYERLEWGRDRNSSFKPPPESVLCKAGEAKPRKESSRKRSWTQTRMQLQLQSVYALIAEKSQLQHVFSHDFRMGKSSFSNYN